MERKMKSALSRDEALKMLEGEKPSCATIKPLQFSDSLYTTVYEIVQERMLDCPHSFHVRSLEVITSPVLNPGFVSNLRTLGQPRPHFLFHGTKEANHKSIFDHGFLLDDHFGDTDKGYIGKGVYLSPHPEYAASYIKETVGIKRFGYSEPVAVDVTCKLLGCIVLTRRTQQLHQKAYATEIESYLESRWAWVKDDGNVTGVQAESFAEECAVKSPKDVYPRFRISLTRVTKEVVWVDPNISNSENSGYIAQLKQEHNISLYATSSSARALTVLGKKKQGVQYRAVTAGRGGEEFIKLLRSAGINCKALVFCGAVDYHKQWAKKFENVEVTNSAATFKKFATWN